MKKERVGLLIGFLLGASVGFFFFGYESIPGFAVTFSFIGSFVVYLKEVIVGWKKPKERTRLASNAIIYIGMIGMVSYLSYRMNEMIILIIKLLTSSFMFLSEEVTRGSTSYTLILFSALSILITTSFMIYVVIALNRLIEEMINFDANNKDKKHKK